MIDTGTNNKDLIEDKFYLVRPLQSYYALKYSDSSPRAATCLCTAPCLQLAGLIRSHGILVQGCKDPRLDGEEHMEAVEEFCLAAQKQWPNCLIQFEDFPTDKVPSVLR